jgi:hypothetical protein
MGVSFFGTKDNPRWVYTPEKTKDSHVDYIKKVSGINKERDGYTGPKRELRLEAKIPMSVEYNWCMMKGIPVHLHSSYMSKHYKELLSEFPVFKVVEKL